MKRFFLYTLLLLCLPMWAQTELLSDLLDGRYNAKTLSQEEQDSILNPVETPQRYRLSYENKRQLFRHSFEADWYVTDTKKNERFPLTEGPARDAQLSPDGRYVVYAKGNNLYIYKLDFRTEVSITHHADPDILSGVSDWLYEEEFGVTRMFAFSPDSKQVAFVRLDEHEVPAFSWQEQLVQNENEQPDYPALRTIRYPRAGQANAHASVCVYDIYYKSVQTMQKGSWEDGYYPRIRWNGSNLLIQHLNRDQNRMEILQANPKTTLCTTLYTEQQSDYCVDYALFDQWHWLSDGRFLALRDEGRFRGVFLHAANGQPLRRLTADTRDVTAVYGFNEETQTLYYQAAPTPETRQAYALNIRKNNLTALTKEEGINELRFARDMQSYICCFQSVNTPNRYTLHRADGKMVREVLTNDSIRQAWAELQLPEMQFFTFLTERGDSLHGWILRPQNVTEKAPVILTQYSGPSSQRVLNRWRKRWDYYLAQEGYVVVCVDPRGTDARGHAWRAQTYMQLGELEAQDQLSAARYAASLPFADPQRIGMIGWSYGAFQVLRTLSEQGRQNSAQPVIRCGLAVAPVTDWRLYDSAYTERYMRRPQVNENGYRNADLSNMAGDLTGEILIVHGLADDNVHAQHTLKYIDALVEAGKQFDMQIYADDDHFLKHRSDYLHAHRRFLRFLDTQLKK